MIELRKSSHGALLFVECGYKYRFFGEDAEVPVVYTILFVFFSIKNYVMDNMNLELLLCIHIFYRNNFNPKFTV